MLTYWFLCETIGFMAYPGFYNIKQPSGDLITVGLRGDDEFSYEVDRFNITILHQAPTSTRYYGIIEENGVMFQSQIPVSNKMSLQELKNLGFKPNYFKLGTQFGNYYQSRYTNPMEKSRKQSPSDQLRTLHFV